MTNDYTKLAIAEILGLVCAILDLNLLLLQEKRTSSWYLGSRSAQTTSPCGRIGVESDNQHTNYNDCRNESKVIPP